MKKILGLIFTLFIVKIAIAQTGCEIPVNNSSITTLNASSCGVQGNYTPYPVGDYTPIKTVRISFYVMMKTDGSGSHTGTDVQIKTFYQDLIDKVNFRLVKCQVLQG